MAFRKTSRISRHPPSAFKSSNFTKAKKTSGVLRSVSLWEVNGMLSLKSGEEKRSPAPNLVEGDRAFRSLPSSRTRVNHYRAYLNFAFLMARSACRSNAFDRCPTTATRSRFGRTTLLVRSDSDRQALQIRPSGFPFCHHGKGSRRSLICRNRLKRLKRSLSSFFKSLNSLAIIEFRCFRGLWFELIS